MKPLGKMFTALASLLASTAVLAVPPHLPNVLVDGNEWKVTAFDDTSPVHTQLATQTLCFFNAGVVGTHQQYYWVSTSYPDWNGYASQEGDQIFMYGDFQWPYNVRRDAGHDGMQWQIVTDNRANMGTGHWNEWIENGQLGVPVGFGNAVFQRIGKCKFQSVSEALQNGQSLDPDVDTNGQVRSPFGVVPKVD